MIGNTTYKYSTFEIETADVAEQNSKTWEERKLGKLFKSGNFSKTITI